MKSAEEKDLEKLQQFVDCRWCPLFHLCDAHVDSRVYELYIRIAGRETTGHVSYHPDIGSLNAELAKQTEALTKQREECFEKFKMATEKCPLKTLLEKK